MARATTAKGITHVNVVDPTTALTTTLTRTGNILMTDDIVTRLRALGTRERPVPDAYYVSPDEAADEIERLRADRDKWRKVADELYFSGNCSEMCVDGAGGCDCSCSWGGAQWEYQQAVRGE